MKKLAILGAVFGVAVAGCGSTGTSCEDIGAHMVKVAKQSGAEAPDGMKESIVGMCKQQKWPEEVRKCMAKVSKEDEVEECLAKVPEFGEYIAKSKTTEAREFIRKLYDGARVYYMDPALTVGSIGAAVAAPQFPTPSAGPTPPLGECCKGSGGKCMPDPGLWEQPPWVALQFSVDDPHFFSYQYQVIDPHKKFVVRAFGDLDCDGVYSTFEMTGEISAASPDEPPGRADLVRKDHLE